MLSKKMGLIIEILQLIMEVYGQKKDSSSDYMKSIEF